MSTWIRLAAVALAAALSGCATLPHGVFTADSGGQGSLRYGVRRYGLSSSPYWVYCVASTSTLCNPTSNPGNGSQGDPAWMAFGKLNTDFVDWFDLNGITVATNGGAPRVATYSDIAALFTGCSGSNVLPDLLTGACVSNSGASMTWPSSAGIPDYSGLSSWGTSYSASNPIPANFLPSTVAYLSAAQSWTALQTFSDGLDLANSEYLTFFNSSSMADAKLEEGPAGYINWYLGTVNGWILYSNSGTDLFDYNYSESGAFNFAEPLYLSNLGNGTQVSCLGQTSTGKVVASSGACGTSSGAVSSITAGSSGDLNITPTTGAAIADLASQANATVCANVSGSSGIPACNTTLPALQGALNAANATTCTPTLAAGATNDFDPTTGGTACTLSGAAMTNVGVVWATPNSSGSTLDGILAGSDKQQVWLCNAAALGTTNGWILLENQSSSEATAANRLMGAGNETLGPQACVMLVYLSGSIDRWSLERVSDAGTPATNTLVSSTNATPDCSFTYTNVTATAYTINAPTSSAATTATTSGSLPASTTYYVGVIATTAAGNTTLSTVESIETGSGTATNTVTANWTDESASEITGYTVFISTATITGGEATVAYTTASSTATSATFTSVPSTTATTPSANTSGLFSINAPTDCTPQPHQRLQIDVLSPSGGAVSYAWNSAYHASSTLPLPTASEGASDKDKIVFEWDSLLSKWDYLASNQGF